MINLKIFEMFLNLNLIPVLTCVSTGIAVFFIASKNRFISNYASIFTLSLIVVAIIRYLSYYMLINNGESFSDKLIIGNLSVAAIVAFGVISVSIICNYFFEVSFNVQLFVSLLIGTTAIIGYIFKKPELYFCIDKFSTSLNLYIAIYLIFLGLNLKYKWKLIYGT